MKTVKISAILLFAHNIHQIIIYNNLYNKSVFIIDKHMTYLSTLQ